MDNVEVNTLNIKSSEMRDGLQDNSSSQSPVHLLQSQNVDHVCTSCECVISFRLYMAVRGHFDSIQEI